MLDVVEVTDACVVCCGRVEVTDACVVCCGRVEVTAMCCVLWQGGSDRCVLCVGAGWK